MLRAASGGLATEATSETAIMVAMYTAVRPRILRTSDSRCAEVANYFARISLTELPRSVGESTVPTLVMILTISRSYGWRNADAERRKPSRRERRRLSRAWRFVEGPLVEHSGEQRMSIAI